MSTNEEQQPETQDSGTKNRQGSSEPAKLAPETDVSTKNRQGSSEPAN